MFALGTVVATQGAMFHADQFPRLLARHLRGDWDMCREDRQANCEAIEQGYRVVGAFEHEGPEKIFIITEWDRSLTTIMLASEY